MNFVKNKDSIKHQTDQYQKLMESTLHKIEAGQPINLIAQEYYEKEGISPI